MSAEELGRSLLSEVQETDLAELLRDVGWARTTATRSSTSAPRDILGIPALDEVLQHFQYPPQRHHGNSIAEGSDNPALNRWRLRQRDPVIEITSPASGDGKTSLLYYISALAILPATFNGIQLGGKLGAVVFLDTDCRFDAGRLRDVAMQLVRDKIRAQASAALDEGGIQLADVRGMVQEALRHVHVFRPKSSHALLATIKSMSSYLCDNTEHVSHGRPLCAILLDSASAFYWQDKREMDVLRIPGAREDREQRAKAGTTSATTSTTTTTLTKSIEIPQIHQGIVKSLRTLQQTFSCPLIYTTWGLYPEQQQNRRPNPHQRQIYPFQSRPAPTLSFSPYLPGPWFMFPTFRLVVQREKVRRFTPGMTLEEAVSDASKRQAVVEKGAFTAWLDPFGKEEWASGIAEAVRQMSGEGSFRFSVTVEGVRLLP